MLQRNWTLQQRAARLKAKIKFVDIESQQRAEIAKTELMKEIEMVEAELEAINLIENEEEQEQSVNQIPVP